jgi:hypothetical protein
MPRRTVGDKNVSSRKEQNRINQRACRERKRRELEEKRDALAFTETSKACRMHPSVNDVNHANLDQEPCQQCMVASLIDTLSPVGPGDAITTSTIGPATSSAVDESLEGSSFVPYKGAMGAEQEHTNSVSGAALADMSALDQGGQKTSSSDVESARTHVEAFDSIVSQFQPPSPSF